MFLRPRINTLAGGPGWRGRLLALLPWVFVLGVAAGTMLPTRDWLARWLPRDAAEIAQTQRERDSETVWRRAGNPAIRHTVEVIRPIDGDTFDARVSLWPDLELTTRVRLRGIDAPELKANCESEYIKAEAASAVLRKLLAEGGVVIFNIGPDKYAGRVVANVATRATPDVSQALLSGGFVRAYQGGRRESWCAR